jgi:hypothetical protein
MSTDSPSTTDRLAEIRARFEATFVQPAGYAPDAMKADAERLAVADGNLRDHARADIEFLLGQVDSWKERFEDVRTELWRQLDARTEVARKAIAEAASLRERLDTAEAELQAAKERAAVLEYLGEPEEHQ